MSLLRSLLLLAVLVVAGAWLAASAALHLLLPAGWQMANWPMTVPGFAVTSPEGATLRWTPMDWRAMRVAGQGVSPRGGGLGRITALDAELEWHGPLAMPAAWREAGGYVEVRGLSVVWGPLRFSGAGELRPVPEGGLQGPLRGRLEGYAEAAALLARAGVISQADARATATPAGREVELPLSLRNGRLMLGPLPLAVWW